MPFDLDIITEVRSAGHHPEDGEALFRDAHQIRATAPNGRRFRHFHVFLCDNNCFCYLNDDGACSCPPQKYGSEAEALAAAERFLARVQAAYDAGKLVIEGSQHWFEVQPAYGSEAFCEAGQDAEDAMMDPEELDAARARRGY